MIMKGEPAYNDRDLIARIHGMGAIQAQRYLRNYLDLPCWSDAITLRQRLWKAEAMGTT